MEAYSLIASTEGVFAEPGSCASIAGVKKQVENGLLKKGSTVVAVLTGNGLKDPDTAIEVNKEKPMLSREQFDAFLSELKAGTSNGGCRDFPSSFLRRPQILVRDLTVSGLH